MMETNENITAIETAGADNQLARLDKELSIMEARSKAQFALTPVGQALKQFEVNQRMGGLYAQSSIVPDTYNTSGIFEKLVEQERKRGNLAPDHATLWQQAANTALANCAIAVDMATRMSANPVMVMQNLYIVHGNPAWSSKFLIATINTCGRFEPLRYEENGKKGDELGWRCFTYLSSDRDHKERLEGPWVTWKMVKAEGWDTKKGSKWLTMPEVMFHYRAAAFWQRMYAPEISMGFNTVEEAQDIQDVPYHEVTPENPASSGSLADIALRNARKAAPAPAAEPEEAAEVKTADMKAAKEAGGVEEDKPYKTPDLFEGAVLID